MRIAHVLRKYNPSEWGGTETAMHRLFQGLREHGLDSVVYCPRIRGGAGADPLAESGCRVRRFRAMVPVWGISRQRRRELVALGGNLMSFELIRCLAREPELSVVHSHALGRLGGIGLTMARRRGIPFVVTVHGGVYDLPEALRRGFQEASVGGLEWGRLFGWLLRSRDVFNDADTILTCNPTEAAEIRERHPDRRVEVQPHGVCVAAYRRDHRDRARAAFPSIRGRELLLVAGRLDPVKNQDWVVKQMPELLRRHPNAMLVLAGPCTDPAYAEPLRRHVERAGLDRRVLFTGGLPPGDPRLIGLFQEARVVVLPSVSETFGLVILEAWAAGTPVIASGTSGARALIEHGRNGWLFDLARPEGFHEAVDLSVSETDAGPAAGRAGHERVKAEFDTVVLSGRIKRLYEQLIEEKNASRHSA